MAKMSEATVVVKDNVNNVEYACQATQYPRETEAGVYLYLKINQIGMQFLQQKGINLKSTKDLEQTWCKNTGMPETGLGSLAKWKTAEDQTKFGVTINGVPFLPGQKKAQAQAVAPVIEVPVVADTTTVVAEDTKFVGMIKDGLEKNVPEASILKAAVGKFGQKRAEQLMSLAKGETPPPAKTEEFSF